MTTETSHDVTFSGHAYVTVKVQWADLSLPRHHWELDDDGNRVLSAHGVGFWRDDIALAISDRMSDSMYYISVGYVDEIDLEDVVFYDENSPEPF